MIYLGHIEQREFGVSNISDAAYLDAQDSQTRVYRKLLDGVPYIAHVGCNGHHASIIKFKDGKIVETPLPWNNIFHCGD